MLPTKRLLIHFSGSSQADYTCSFPHRSCATFASTVHSKVCNARGLTYGSLGKQTYANVLPPSYHHRAAACPLSPYAMSHRGSRARTQLHPTAPSPNNLQHVNRTAWLVDFRLYPSSILSSFSAARVPTYDVRTPMTAFISIVVHGSRDLLLTRTFSNNIAFGRHTKASETRARKLSSVYCSKRLGLFLRLLPTVHRHPKLRRNLKSEADGIPSSRLVTSTITVHV